LASGGFGTCEGFLGRDGEVYFVEVGASGRIHVFPRTIKVQKKIKLLTA
jgi:hypothetical protein